MTDLVFSELPASRRREIISAVAHYIAGVLDKMSMVEIVQSLWTAADYRVGDRVKTLRSSTHGTVVRLVEDGRVAWRPDGTETELLALPESLLRDPPQAKRSES